MKKTQGFSVRNATAALLALSALGIAWMPGISLAADDAATPPAAAPAAPSASAPAEGGAAAPADQAASGDVTCCKPGDTTPPPELVKKIPPGGLHNPYDYKELAKDPDLVKQFRLPGCNECHGGTGGGGFCPALTQGVWFWGNTDDILFRLATLGSAELQKEGFERYQYGSVQAGMPPMGFAVPTADQLWKIIAFIRSINPPGANPPEKVIPGKYTPPAAGAPAPAPTVPTMPAPGAPATPNQ